MGYDIPQEYLKMVHHGSDCTGIKEIGTIDHTATQTCRAFLHKESYIEFRRDVLIAKGIHSHTWQFITIQRWQILQNKQDLNQRHAIHGVIRLQSLNKHLERSLLVSVSLQ